MIYTHPKNFTSNFCGLAACMYDRGLSCRVLFSGVLSSGVIWLVLFVGASAADDPSTPLEREIEFFESEIRPLLIDRCFECHSSESKPLRGGLRLDSHASLLRGGDSGPVLMPGKPEDSILIASIRYESNEMPPDRKLSDVEIGKLTQWVQMGAAWPAEGGSPATSGTIGYDWDALQAHWSWQPLVIPDLPEVAPTARIVNPIDRFVVARLQAVGLPQPASASPRTFVRRAFLDLLGIPPKPDELAQWVERLDAGDELNDESVVELIDTLLERPQYGERWGRHWLDVARYSDTGGWTQDSKSQPMAWRYRDWVVAAFNSDMPYNEFVRRQIIGDLLDRESAVATGFFALGPTYSSDGGDPESIAQATSESLDDRVDTFSRAFLGLTMACARCHDHKFDPIPAQDYYSIAGVFNNTQETETPLVTADVIETYDRSQQQIAEQRERIQAIEKAASEPTKRELSEEEKADVERLNRELEALVAQAPQKYDYAHTLRESGDRDMQVALRGNLLKPGEDAPRRFLRILAGENRATFHDGSGRTELAEAVVAPKNPLISRVIVNRLWLNHFGNALVRTPNNFGTLGETPTHPELLDWLATTLIAKDWSIKAMHRLIMNSATYRSSSGMNEAAYEADGENRSVWRMSPRRMDAETWRDSLLAVTGELDLSLGGASIENIAQSNRRTLYARVSRNDPTDSDLFLRLFDFPIPRASSGKRTSNIIPQQYLFMMNSPFMLARAQALAQRVQDANDDFEERIVSAYETVYGRLPSARELSAGVAFLNQDEQSGSRLNRWQQYCQVLLSSNEFMYVR